MVNDETVTKVDIEASNRGIHVLNKVLIPAAEKPPVTTIPDTGLVGITPYLGATLLSGLALVALKKRK